MATEDDEIYNDAPSNESVRNVHLIRNMFEVGKKSENPAQGKSAKPPTRISNGIGPNKAPAKVPGPTGKNGGTPPVVPSKTSSAVPPKATTESKVPPPLPKNNQKSSVSSTNHLGTTVNGTNGTVPTVPDKGLRPVHHNGTGGEKNMFQCILRKKPSATPTPQPTQPLKVPSDWPRVSELSGDRSTVYPPNGAPAVSVSSQRHPSKDTKGYCLVSPHRPHPKSPLTGKGSGNLLVSGHKKTYRKLPVPTTRTPAPRKKPLPPGLPKNFAQKYMAEKGMAKKVSVEAKISIERDSQLLAYDDIYEDVRDYEQPIN